MAMVEYCENLFFIVTIFGEEYKLSVFQRLPIFSNFSGKYFVFVTWSVREIRKTITSLCKLRILTDMYEPNKICSSLI
jgi:hypothetical protein